MWSKCQHMKSEAQNGSIVLLCPRNERRRRLLCQSNGGNYFYDLFHLGFYVPQLRYPLTRLLAAASRINTTHNPLPSVSLKGTTTGFQTFNLDILDEWIRAAKKHKRRRSSRALLLFYFIHSRSFMWIYTFSGKRRRRRTDMQSFRDFRYSFGELVK